MMWSFLFSRSTTECGSHEVGSVVSVRQLRRKGVLQDTEPPPRRRHRRNLHTSEYLQYVRQTERSNIIGSVVLFPKFN